MTIHGLWPALTNGVHLPPCNTGPSITITEKGLSNYSLLQQIWPSLTGNTSIDFWTHEYNKHGYCYVMKEGKANYSYYFDTVIHAFNPKQYKNVFTKAFSGQIGDMAYSIEDVMDRIAAALGHSYFKMICRQIDGRQRVTELQISLGLNFNLVPAKPNGTTCKTNQMFMLSLIRYNK